jgi:hypothetical protein
MVTRVEHIRQSSGTKKQREHKKQVEVKDIESDEEEEKKTSGDNGSISLGGGGDKIEGQGGRDEGEEEKFGGEATVDLPPSPVIEASTPPPEDPPVGTMTPQNRKVTPKKPPVKNPLSLMMTLVWSMKLWRMPLKTCCRDTKIFLAKGVRMQKNGLKPTCPKFDVPMHP